MPTIHSEPPVEVSAVRYIKLGKGGSWTEDCIQSRTVRLGFNTEQHLQLCLEGKWDSLREVYINEGRKKGIATNRKNQVQSFFEDSGDIIWITFHDTFMWWTSLDPVSVPVRAKDSEGTERRTLSGWSSTNIKNESLYLNNLSGHLTQLAGFKGTSCSVADAEYVIRRINGQFSPEAERAERLRLELEDATHKMMRRLTPQDFELLVDLVFSSSGWRRLGSTGGTQKTLDLDLILPTTHERSFVQVKSEVTQKEFDQEYREVFFRMKNMGQYHRMFYAYHSGAIECDDTSITLLDGPALARLIIDTGLVSWLIERVS